MIPPPLALEIEERLHRGEGPREISADLAIPMADVQQVRDRMVAAAAPRDHRLDSLLAAGDGSTRPATRRLAARARALVDDLRGRVAEEGLAARARALVDDLRGRVAEEGLAARARALVDDLRGRVAEEAEERKLQAEVDRLAGLLLDAQAALRNQKTKTREG